MTSRILIVDDHAGFRSQARALLEEAGYGIVGEAGDARSAITAVRELDPQVVLLDVQLPDGDGFSVADEIGRNNGAPRIVFISSREAADYGTRLTQGMGVGFIHKPELSSRRLAELIGTPG